MRILINHIGYARQGTKRAVVMGTDGEQAGGFRIVDSAGGQTVYIGETAEGVQVDGWRNWRFWTADFDGLETEGFYYIECDTSAGTLRSPEFRLEANLLGKQSLSDVIFYLKAQRCSGDFDRADRSLPFAGDREGRHDLHGGWYDATGDYGKHLSHLSHAAYFNPQQGSFTAWVLFKTHDLLEGSGNPHYYQFRRRILDEALHGADYMYRMKAPSGSFFRSVCRSGEFMKAEDRRINFLYKRSSAQFGAAATAVEELLTDESYETGFRQGAGFAIAALAAASRYAYPGDYTREQYLTAAKDAFSHLEPHNARYLNDGKPNVLDEYCRLTALTELYKASLDPDYLKKAGETAERLTGYVQTSGIWRNYWSANEAGRPFFHPSDAGLPVAALLNYLDIEKDAGKRAKALAAAKQTLEFELAVTGDTANPFGLARQLVQGGDGMRYTSFFLPHDTEAAPWWQGENARLASMAAAARLLAAHLEPHDPWKRELAAYADRQLNWILGLNPFDSCMLQGSGRNNPAYHFKYGFDYMNCPGGICNGITGGLAEPSGAGIDYFPAAQPGVVDDNWRWSEQWLPHASWYMYAVALGDLADDIG